MSYQWLRTALEGLGWQSVNDGVVGAAGSVYIISPTQQSRGNTTTAREAGAPHFHYFPEGDGRNRVGYPHGRDANFIIGNDRSWYGDPDNIYVEVSDYQMNSGNPHTTKTEICKRLGYALDIVERMDALIAVEQNPNEAADLLAFRNWYLDKIVDHLTTDNQPATEKKKKKMLLMCLYEPQKAMGAGNTLKVGMSHTKFLPNDINRLRPVYQEFIGKLARRGIGDPEAVKMGENLTKGKDNWFESSGKGAGAGSGRGNESLPIALTKEKYLETMVDSQLKSEFQEKVRQQQASTYGGVEMIIQALINPNKLLELRNKYLQEFYPLYTGIFNFEEFSQQQVIRIRKEIFKWTKKHQRQFDSWVEETRQSEQARFKPKYQNNIRGAETLFVTTLHRNIDSVFGYLLKLVLNKSVFTVISPEITDNTHEQIAIEARREIAQANGAIEENKKLYPVFTKEQDEKDFIAMMEKKRLNINKNERVGAPTREKLEKKKREMVGQAQRDQLKMMEKLQVLQRRGEEEEQERFKWANAAAKKEIPELENLDELTRAGIVQLVNQEFINRMLNNLSAQIMDKAKYVQPGYSPAAEMLNQLFETLPKGKKYLSDIVDATNNKVTHRAIRQQGNNNPFEKGSVFYHHLTAEDGITRIRHSVKGARRGHREHMFYPDEYVQLRIPADRSHPQGADLIAFISTKTERGEPWQELDYGEVLTRLQGGANGIAADDGDGVRLRFPNNMNIRAYVFNIDNLKVARKAGRRNAGGSRRTRRRRKHKKRRTIKKSHKKKKHKKKRTIKKRHKKRKHNKRTRKH